MVSFVLVLTSLVTGQQTIVEDYHGRRAHLQCAQDLRLYNRDILSNPEYRYTLRAECKRTR